MASMPSEAVAPDFQNWTRLVWVAPMRGEKWAFAGKSVGWVSRLQDVWKVTR
jgi:hypothetical protein